MFCSILRGACRMADRVTPRRRLQEGHAPRRSGARHDHRGADMVYVLLCLLLALLCSAEDAPRQQQEEEERRLERIRPTYHRVLRDAYGAEWSDAEIDDYLYRIIHDARLARPEAEVGAAAALVTTTTPQPSPSATVAAVQPTAMKPTPPLDAAAAGQPASMQSDELLKCQPRLRVFSVTHFHPRQPGQQRAIYRPSCVALHRCSADAGCCREHHDCVAAETRNVTLGFVQVTASRHGGADENMVYLTFENHTECHCHSNASRTPQRCVCPWPYVPAESQGQSQAPRRRQGCDCVCPDAAAAAAVDGDGDAGDDSQRRQQQAAIRVSTCADVSSGRRVLPWPLSRNNDMSKSHYRACAASTVAEFSNRPSLSSTTSAQQPSLLVRCGLPACASGGAFSFASWTCPAAVAAAATGPSDGQSEREVLVRSTSHPAETVAHSLRRRNRQRDSEPGAAAVTTPPPTQLSAIADRAAARGSVHTALGMGDDSAGGRDASPRSPDGILNERRFIAHRCADRSCSSASTRRDDDRQQNREQQRQHGHSNPVGSGYDDTHRYEQLPLRHHHQLSDNADMKLLAWTRPGVVLEGGGSSARTKLGRELWTAAESLWTMGQGSRGRDGEIGGESATALVVCQAPSRAVVTVEPGSSVSCSLHEPSQKYLVRTSRGNLLCGANGGG